MWWATNFLPFRLPPTVKCILVECPDLRDTCVKDLLECVDSLTITDLSINFLLSTFHSYWFLILICFIVICYSFSYVFTWSLSFSAFNLWMALKWLFVCQCAVKKLLVHKTQWTCCYHLERTCSQRDFNYYCLLHHLFEHGRDHFEPSFFVIDRDWY